ncbi:hypothetical protein [Nostoc sp. MG11]|uniref:hypothetical protein n=1 Tax=Nostoc sp. MG11 TaxID=2721166 RepID=UPI00186835C5|nr:hypothetical protein [Nostoc sp. MG11]
MTHSLVQGKNNSWHEGTPQTDSLRDSSVNHALIAIAQEVTNLLRQTYPIQTDEIKTGEQNDTAR